MQATANANGMMMVATDRRLAISDDNRVVLDIPYNDLRRIQFDIEKQRPATLVVVPEREEPQVLVVGPEGYDEVAQTLVVVGRRLAALS